MNIETVNELIQSLESAGELSIKERKYLELAKAYLDVAAENVGLKDINAWCKTDVFKNMYREFKTAEALGCSDADCMHDAMLVAIMHAPETPATDRIVAGIKADGVEEFVSNTVHKIFDESGAVSALAYLSLANSHVKQLREVADK